MQKKYNFFILICSLLLLPLGQVNAADTTIINGSINKEEITNDSYTPSLQSSEDSNLVYLPLIQTESNKMTLTIIQSDDYEVIVEPTGPYNVGEQVTATAIASPGYIFTGWKGDIQGTTNPITITMNNHKTISASVEAQYEGIYFVSTTGNDNNPGTYTQPWRSIQNAANELKAGETVLIRDGVYNERIVPLNSGLEGNYITYAAYPNEEVIIDGTGVSLPYSEDGLFYLSNKHYIKIQNLTIQNSKDMGVYAVGTYSPRINTTNIILSNLKVFNSNDEAIKVVYGDTILVEKTYTKESVSSGIGIWKSNNVILDGNTVVNARNAPAAVGHEECISLASVTNFEVKNNEVYFENFQNYLGSAGIDAKVIKLTWKNT